jgi:hypothetical protein
MAAARTTTSASWTAPRGAAPASSQTMVNAASMPSSTTSVMVTLGGQVPPGLSSCRAIGAPMATPAT